MNNILKVTAITVLAFVANNSQATELVKVQQTTAFEFLEIAKVNLAQSIKLNTIEISSIKKAARTQLVMARTKAEKSNDASVKISSFAE